MATYCFIVVFGTRDYFPLFIVTTFLKVKLIYVPSTYPNWFSINLTQNKPYNGPKHTTENSKRATAYIQKEKTRERQKNSYLPGHDLI